MSDSTTATQEKPRGFVTFLRERVFQRGKLLVALYLLALPTIISLLIFDYYPKLDVILMSVFRWEPPSIQEFVGLRNFVDAFTDPLFWSSFKLAGYLFLANLIKMWPSIFAAIAVHRLASDKLRYYFQVCFVLPMVIPSIVGLLIWKSFFEPDFGILNRFLNATGLMELLAWLDQVMPASAAALAPVFNYGIDPAFGSIYGLALLGALLLVFRQAEKWPVPRREGYVLILITTAVPALAAALVFLPGMARIAAAVVGFGVVFVFLARRLGREWIAWPFLTLAGLFIFWGELWRMPLIFGLAIAISEILSKRRDPFAATQLINRTGLVMLLVSSLLIIFGTIWINNTEQFAHGTPAWLGNKDLVIPALLFWGFPWVGTTGVLIYLAGLQNISQDVYEAAELDGVSPIGMIWYIELPLILTQVRINLIFMTIATLVSYERFLLLLGPDGGPGNKGIVPGLYIFNVAFSEGRFGYGCALGLILFVIILTLTLVYQRYIRVDK